MLIKLRNSFLFLTLFLFTLNAFFNQYDLNPPIQIAFGLLSLTLAIQAYREDNKKLAATTFFSFLIFFIGGVLNLLKQF